MRGWSPPALGLSVRCARAASPRRRRVQVRLGRLQKRLRYQHFYHEGGVSDGLFILVSGAVRLAAGRDKPCGREVRPPMVLGLEALVALDLAAIGSESTPSMAPPLPASDATDRGPIDSLVGAMAVQRLEGAMALVDSICVLVQGHCIRSMIFELAAASPFYAFSHAAAPVAAALDVDGERAAADRDRCTPSHRYEQTMQQPQEQNTQDHDGSAATPPDSHLVGGTSAQRQTV